MRPERHFIGAVVEGLCGIGVVFPNDTAIFLEIAMSAIFDFDAFVMMSVIIAVQNPVVFGLLVPSRCFLSAIFFGGPVVFGILKSWAVNIGVVIDLFDPLRLPGNGSFVIVEP